MFPFRVRSVGMEKLKIALLKVRPIPSGHDFHLSLDAKPGAGGDPHQIIHERTPSADRAQGRVAEQSVAAARVPPSPPRPNVWDDMGW